ncbi:hypothetical protein F4818DRAFT_454044 [Hypoxylon cercidicola]|nr:hypothetical protein F4818DRAFT_454044 [Hypoxylon cercidicola]
MANISATYLAYKRDTAVYLSWLTQESQKYGWKRTTTTTRLKGKARKNAKKAKGNAGGTASSQENAHSTTEILEQIELIQQAVGTIKAKDVPLFVKHALLRCIGLRERFASWYRKTKSDESSNRTHQYFIDILWKGLSLFQQADDNTGSTNPSGNKADEKDEQFMLNMFKALQVDDAPGQDESDNAEDRNTSKTSATGEFDMEPDDTEEVFKIFCHFEDVHRIHDESVKVLRRVASGELDIVKATILIGAALDLVQRAEAETVQALTSINFAGDVDKRFPGGTFPAFVGKIYNSKALKRENERNINDEKSALLITAFDELVFLPLGRILIDFGYYATRKQTIHASYIMVPGTILNMTYVDEEGLRDESRTEKAKEAVRFLLETLYDMRFVGRVMEGHYKPLFDHLARETGLPSGTQPTLPFHDILHNALSPVWERSTVSMKAAFAARILVDMHDICGPSGISVQSKAIKMYTERLNCLLDKSGSSDIPDLELPMDRNSQNLLAQIRKRVQYDLTPDPLWGAVRKVEVQRSEEVRQQTLQAIREHQASGQSDEATIQAYIESTNNAIWPNESDNFLVKSNLLYGGSAVADLIPMLELAGVTIALRNFSVLCMAHIYNVVRQHRQHDQLDVVWPEMDQVIELQGSALFANDIPTTRPAMLDRFMYTLGLSRRDVRGDALKKNLKPRAFQPAPTSDVLSDFFDGQEDLSRLIYQLQDEASQREGLGKQRSHPKSGKGAQKSTTTSGSAATDEERQLTLRQGLQRLEKHLDAVLPAMNFDYIIFTKTCTGLLSSLRRELASQLNVTYTEAFETRREYARVETVLKILRENENAEIAHDTAKRNARKNQDTEALNRLPEEAPVGPQLQHATKFLTKFLTP